MVVISYVISRDLEKCELLCDLCCDVIPSLKEDKVKIGEWAYNYNNKCLTELQAECPFNALRIDKIKRTL